MKKVYAMIANGSEEVECLAVVDILKRANIDTVLVSIEEIAEVVSAHGTKIIADTTVSEVDFSDGDAIFVPGGIPGSNNLASCEKLIDGLREALADGRRVAAICAAPGVVLGAHGLLKGKNATCFPGFGGDEHGANYTGAGVVTDGLITTGRGLGFAIDLGLELVALLESKELSLDIKKKIQHWDA